jgi:hypothetical protein
MPKTLWARIFYANFIYLLSRFFGDLRGDFGKRKTRFVDKFAV